MNKQSWLIAGLLLNLTMGVAQEKPVDIPKNELPKKAECVVCEAQGSGHGLETPKAGVRYKDQAYYFCNPKEVPEFKANPESWLPLPLPMASPAVAMKTLRGEPFKLESLRGKVVLVDFWATWCKPCIDSLPSLQKLHEKYQSQNFALVGISIDEEGAPKVQSFLKNRPVNYLIALDNGSEPLFEKLRVKAIPALFLIDRQGQIVRQWTGKPDIKQIEKEIDALLK